MTRVLVAYGSSEGQTAAVAERIADVLESDGHEPTLVDLGHSSADLESAEYDGAIVGASIHAGAHQRYVAEFVRDHRETLNRLPSAFYSVSLSAASEDEESQAAAEELLEGFLEETGWDPDGTLSVAGALRYSEYGLLKRFMMRRIASEESGDTDTSRDYEYTDWEDVESFAREFSTLVS
ncbi:menaquinone-dependent protoporphyrinogen oxidase [Halobiforma haloterrestris]|uniref:Menaquinone-dependent protoporphyrinogen oxidase n=1 Tax=Natronobacterium haloterrestre TaxID=148448 RepID=A0A1I1E1W1_NATHA|nr:flavodoxin domain-containing protein [Halobiforma haloterrestris]SFB78950.1 menaquinone-dependent protoporphyrinogen oxidase [Halobiforma haloterrestris]